MKICVLIAAFNEAEHIASVVRGAREFVDQVVVIDDGSRDGTAAAAERAGAVCLRLPANRGKATALRTGIDYAHQGDFTHFLFMDGDGQHKPRDIPSLVGAARANEADLVIGTRTFDRAAMPVSRYCSNRLGSAVASWLAGREIRDSQSGFRLVRADKLRRITLRGTRYEFEMEVLIKMCRAGCVVAHAPVECVYVNGAARSKMNPVRDTVRICFSSLGFRFLGR